MASGLSLSSLNLAPIEPLIVNTFPFLAFFIVGLVKFFLLHSVFGWFKDSRVCTSDAAEAKNFKKSRDLGACERKPSLKVKSYDGNGSVSRNEVEMVLGKLGIFCHPESQKLQDRFDSEDLIKLFEEKEPTIDEVKEAFDVFDQNRDGFIDESELQRVLKSLGLFEGSEIENCTRMIQVFDENRDGRIDLAEFVKMF